MSDNPYPSLVIETGPDWHNRQCPKCGRWESRSPDMPTGLFCMPCSGHGPPIEEAGLRQISDIINPIVQRATDNLETQSDAG